MVPEQFRGPSQGPGLAGSIVGRRAAGSKGIDVLLQENQVDILGIDLKTGRGWSANQINEYQRRFQVPIEQIYTGN